MAGFTKALQVDVSPSGSGHKKAQLDNDEFGYYNYGDFGGAGIGVPNKVLTSSLTFNQMDGMYTFNVWVRACVDKIVKRAVAVAPQVKSILKKHGEKPTDSQKRRIAVIENLLAVPNNQQTSFDNIRSMIFTDTLIYDASAMELVQGDKGVEEMYAVSGDSVKLNVNQKGIFKSIKKAYLQVDSRQKVVASFANDELIYFLQYPRAGRVYGKSPLESLSQTVTAELYSADFNLKRFINDATPRIAIMFENLGLGQGGEAMQRMRKWWDSELKGKPHKPILIGSENGSIKFEKIGLTNEDMQFQEYSRWLLSKIMVVYRMQAAVLGVIDTNQGRVNSAYQETQFKKDALRPLLLMLSNQMNTTAIWSKTNFGFNDIYLDWEGLDFEDKKIQAQIHEIYIKTGVFTINMVLKQLGMEPVTWGDVPYMFNQFQPVSDIVSPDKNISNSLFKNLSKDLDGFDLSSWLVNGLSVGGVIPTGLERVEKGDIKVAVDKILKIRDSYRSSIELF